jgi:hypothetical protein
MWVVSNFSYRNQKERILVAHNFQDYFSFKNLLLAVFIIYLQLNRLLRIFMWSPYKNFVFFIKGLQEISAIKQYSNFGSGCPERQILFGSNWYIVPLRHGEVNTWKKTFTFKIHCFSDLKFKLRKRQKKALKKLE